MKKEYSTPIVEKIAFNYRDQVVAASGDVSILDQGGSSAANERSDWGCIAKWATEYLQYIPTCIF